MPKQIVKKIFDVEKGFNVVSFENGNAYLANIQNILIDSNQEDQRKISLHDDLRGSFGNELMKNVKISTNDNLINAIINRY